MAVHQSTRPTIAANDRRPAPRRWVGTALLTLLAAVIGVAFLLPAVWMLLGSLRPGSEVIGSVSPLSWRTLVPDTWTLDNYGALFGQLGFGRSLANSLLVALVSVLLGLALSVPAAYALTVLRFPGREGVFALLVVGFMVPFEAIAIPMAQLFTQWHLDNTYVGLILPGIGNGLAIFNLRQFFRGVPSSLREAAIVDGAGEFRIMTRLYVPLSTTALINSALLIFLGQWSAYLWPLLLVSDQEKQVAAIAIARTFSDTEFNFGQMFGGALLISVVPAVLLLLLQRYFATSIASSGEKG
ncbi:carbohydrate ABC transporter permease [uncultured Pseudokineococcus sp.]|uniref:carbohydrate ABC transporter permease n=1 Tax=uncultured Pseudokineococcus sp. TaxID=1642928 RepID=UPI0026190ED4|nr:carbohydrate ABC transporter permease [uncultured Pseudokineococcus sp.]